MQKLFPPDYPPVDSRTNTPIPSDSLRAPVQARFNHIFTVMLLLISISLIILMTGADLALEHLIFNPNHQWPGQGKPPWSTLYTVGPLPGLILGGTALVCGVLGTFISCLKKFRKPAVFLVLLLIVGPGLITNVILKDHVGRPRPQELKTFGGEYQFVQFWTPGPGKKNSSFPSGHASIAFYMMAPWFIFRKKSRTIALFSLNTGLLFGFLVGAARIMQGAHFLSDIVWAGGLVYIVAEVLSWYCLDDFNISFLNPTFSRTYPAVDARQHTCSGRELSEPALTCKYPVTRQIP